MQTDLTWEDVTVQVGADSIRGSLVMPQGGVSAVVVVRPATATPQRFYAGFAEAIAARGAATITYDYRGTGRSGDPRRLRHLGMRNWMSEDVPAVAGWTASPLSPPIWV